MPLRRYKNYNKKQSEFNRLKLAARSKDAGQAVSDTIDEVATNLSISCVGRSPDPLAESAESSVASSRTTSHTANSVTENGTSSSGGGSRSSEPLVKVKIEPSPDASHHAGATSICEVAANGTWIDSRFSTWPVRVKTELPSVGSAAIVDDVADNETTNSSRSAERLVTCERSTGQDADDRSCSSSSSKSSAMLRCATAALTEPLPPAPILDPAPATILDPPPAPPILPPATRAKCGLLSGHTTTATTDTVTTAVASQVERNVLASIAHSIAVTTVVTNTAPTTSYPLAIVPSTSGDPVVKKTSPTPSYPLDIVPSQSGYPAVTNTAPTPSFPHAIVPSTSGAFVVKKTSPSPSFPPVVVPPPSDALIVKKTAPTPSVPHAIVPSTSRDPVVKKTAPTTIAPSAVTSDVIVEMSPHNGCDIGGGGDSVALEVSAARKKKKKKCAPVYCDLAIADDLAMAEELFFKGDYEVALLKFLEIFMKHPKYQVSGLKRIYAVI